MSVAVVTDTTTYLPRALLDREGIHEVSLYVNEGATATAEAVLNADLDSFYDRLRSGAEVPKTSQPSAGDFLDVYLPLLDAGHDIISIHLSAAISGTTGTALLAAGEAAPPGGPRRIEVVDSQTACGGLGLIVLAAAEAANTGLGIDAVLARTLEARDARGMWFSLDTLEYLRRGGRIGRVQSWLGGALAIKPILSVDEEGVKPIERVRTQRRAFERMAEFAEQLRDDDKTAYCVQHIQSHAAAAMLARRATEILGREPAFISEIGPVIGTHAGPGLLGIGATAGGLLATG